MALFAALSYAITKSGRTSGKTIDAEKARLDAALQQQCMAYVERGFNMLHIVGGCPVDQISHELPDGSNPNPNNADNTACFVFHPDGANLTPCGTYLESTCSLAALPNVGDACDGIVYAGESGGHRIYTTLTDLPGTLSWKIGSWAFTTATSPDDGPDNTDKLVNHASSYPAAEACHDLGAAWYLPAINELAHLHSVRNTGALAGTFTATGGTASRYWSSTDDGNDDSARYHQFSNNTSGWTYENTAYRVRCIRRD